MHVTQLFSFPTGDPSEMQGLTEDERAALDVLTWFWENIGAFNVLQSQAPQTLAFGLADSPVALLAWNSQLMLDQDDDFLVGNVATYWFTDTAGSSIRLYRENHLAQHRPAGSHHCSDRPLVVGQRLPLDPAVRGAGPLRHPDVAAA